MNMARLCHLALLCVQLPRAGSSEWTGREGFDDLEVRLRRLEDVSGDHGDRLKSLADDMQGVSAQVTRALRFRPGGPQRAWRLGGAPLPGPGVRLQQQQRYQ
jgi:hypothetical protein